MKTIRDLRYLIAGLVFLSLVIGSLALIATSELGTELLYVLAIVAGMAAMATLSAFQRYTEGSAKSPLIQITFNERLVRDALEESLSEPKEDETVTAQIIPWEVNPEDLIGRDNTLALAKMRIDIERELRRIALGKGVDPQIRAYDIRELVEILVRRKILAPPIATALYEILPAANEAIHGGEVSTETTASVLRAGNDVLRYLQGIRSVPEEKTESKND